MNDGRLRMVFSLLVIGISPSAVAAPLDQDPSTVTGASVDPLPLDRQLEDATGSTTESPDPAGNAELESLPEYQAAQQALRNGDMQRCEEILRGLHARRPNLSPPRIVIARLLIGLGEIQTAQALLEDMAGAHLGNPELYVLFGMIALAQGRATDAGLHFEKATELRAPTHWTDEQRRRFEFECLVGESLVAERHRDWGKAVQLYRRRVAAAPGDVQLRTRWANALYRHGHVKDALEQFGVAYRQQPDMNPPEASLALLHAEDGKLQQAHQWIEKAVANHANVPAVHLAHSIILMYEDRSDEAEQAAARAAELGLDSRALLMQQGDIAAQQHKFEHAEGFYRQLLERSPQDLGVITSLAIVLAGQDDPEKVKEALELMEAAAGRHPNSPVVRSVLGWARLSHGEFEAAAALLETAAAQLGDEPTTLLFLGVALMKLERQDEGLKVAERLSHVIDQPGTFIFRPTARRWLAEVLPEDK